MAEQESDVILCDFENFTFEGLRLYGVVRGDVHSNNGWGEPYEFKWKPKPLKRYQCSSLWRGFISVYELRGDGSIYLVSYKYPYSEQNAEHFEEKLEGDFWLLMKPSFSAPRIYVPFVDSKIITDEDKWEVDRRSIEISIDEPWYQLLFDRNRR